MELDQLSPHSLREIKNRVKAMALAKTFTTDNLILLSVEYDVNSLRLIPAATKWIEPPKEGSWKKAAIAALPQVGGYHVSYDGEELYGMRGEGDRFSLLNNRLESLPNTRVDWSAVKADYIGKQIRSADEIMSPAERLANLKALADRTAEGIAALEKEQAETAEKARLIAEVNAKAAKIKKQVATASTAHATITSK